MKLEIKNTTPFTLGPPKIKYLGLKLTKCVQVPCEENYKIPMTEIKRELCTFRSGSPKTKPQDT